MYRNLLKKWRMWNSKPLGLLPHVKCRQTQVTHNEKFVIETMFYKKPNTP